jgi:hypothetical protein
MSNGERAKLPRFWAWFPYLLATPLVGLAGITIYSFTIDKASVFAVALVVAGGAFLTGGLLGFLFGVPRSLAGSETLPAEGAATGGYRANTNLEQISDWLTKILVGVGLVELGTLIKNGRRLAEYLAPALGDRPSSPSFAVAILILFAISGFLIFYLVTRLYLGPVFARAEEMMKVYVDQRIEEVEESRRQQEQNDVRALSLVNRVLQPDPGAPPVSQEELNEAIAAASPLVRAQIFARARDQRARAWRSREPEERDQMDRTVPVFHALVTADPDRYHRNYGQLGYALKDKREPDLTAAEAALTEAINIRDRRGEQSYFLLYEFNRAHCRILLDPSFAKGEKTDAESARAILGDLQRAARLRGLRDQILASDPFARWLALNELTEDDLTGR